MRGAMRRWTRITVSLAAALALHALLLLPLPRRQAAMREAPLRVELVPRLPHISPKPLKKHPNAKPTATANGKNLNKNANVDEIGNENQHEQVAPRWSREWS